MLSSSLQLSHPQRKLFNWEAEHMDKATEFSTWFDSKHPKVYLEQPVSHELQSVSCQLTMRIQQPCP